MESVVIPDQKVKARRKDPRELSTAISVELRRMARKARLAKPVSSGGGGFRARRSDKAFRAVILSSLLFVFILPSIISVVYYGIIASDQFVSEARFLVKSSDGREISSFGGLGALLGGQSTDAAIVSEYIHSRAMIEALGKKFDLRKIFSSDEGDFFARINPDASAEDLVEHWEKQVSIKTDRASGLITLTVRTFSPETSRALAGEIVELSERMVNDLTGRNRSTSLVETHEGLLRSQEVLRQAVIDLRDARNEAGILDADVENKAITEIMTALSLEESKVDVQIASLIRTETTSGPQLRALQARAAAIKDQLATYQQQLAGGNLTGQDRDLADRSASLSQRALEVKIAQNEYARASASYELARLNAERQKSYLLTYVQPRRADEALYPNRVLMSFVVSISAFIAWAVLAGIALLVRDHTAA
ncbi:hypothetical protein C6558_37940 [Ensifer sp. NM-2]|nr:hypothetical protein C6558_37940 [Ensifer sp. NM-2]